MQKIHDAPPVESSIAMPTIVRIDRVLLLMGDWETPARHG